MPKFARRFPLGLIFYSARKSKPLIAVSPFRSLDAYFFGGLTALASSLPNLFTSKRRSSSRNASSLARCFSLSGFFGFDRFRGMLELYRSDGRWASYRTS